MKSIFRNDNTWLNGGKIRLCTRFWGSFPSSLFKLDTCKFFFYYLFPIAVPFDYCERPPIISHGFMKTSPENAYHVLSEARKGIGKNIVVRFPTFLKLLF